MADDVNPALRAELEAAKAVLEPQIRGLHDLTHVSISSDLEQEILLQVEKRERRRDLIQSVLDGLDRTVDARGALEDDGYPALEDAQLSDAMLGELREENDDLKAAVNLFKRDGAATLSINLGEP